MTTLQPFLLIIIIKEKRLHANKIDRLVKFGKEQMNMKNPLIVCASMLDNYMDVLDESKNNHRENVIVIDGETHRETKNKMLHYINKHLLSKDGKYHGCIIVIVCIIFKPDRTESNQHPKPSFYFDKIGDREHIDDLRKSIENRIDMPLW